MPACQYKLAQLEPAVHPFRLHYYDELESTNDHAHHLRQAGQLFAPAMVLASSQTRGRGRGANPWSSLEGCITVSFILPVEENLQPHQLPLVAGLAVRGAAAELSGDIDIALKWPNDIIMESRKLAGLLCERRNGVDVIGVGLNVNSVPPDVRRSATSLAEIAGRPIDMTRALIVLAAHLQHRLLTRLSRPFAAFLDEYREHDGLLGRDLELKLLDDLPPATGTCEGIDTDGRLLLRTPSGLERIVAGSVRIL